MTRDKLKSDYLKLSNDNNFPDSVDKRRRGREFEKLINKLLELEGLDPATGFRPKGEEIDGSFIIGHSVFLIEAKWHKSEMPASSIYQFKGKVDGKLVGTIGVYISMSGFSSEAVDALTFGKSINIILFDRDDFSTSINEENGFRKVLMKKLRMATEKGTVYFQVKSTNISSEPTTTESKVSIKQINTANLFTERQPQHKIPKDKLTIIVEGKTDVKIITAFAERIFDITKKRKEINILVAGGKYSVAKLANIVQNNLSDKSDIIIVADSDGNIEETQNLLYQSLENKKITIIIPDPEIEVWLSDSLNYNRRELKNMLMLNRQNNMGDFDSFINKINIETLRKNDASFGKLYEIISK